MEYIKKILKKVTCAERWVCAFMLIIMLVILFVQVVLRYCFNAPFSWAEEVTLMFLVWFGYLCMSLDIFTDSHAAIYFLYNKFPPTVKKIADLLRHGLLLWFFYEMIKYGLQITRLGIPKRQPASGFSQGWLFAPLVVGGILMFIFSLFNFISVFVTKEKNGECT